MSVPNQPTVFIYTGNGVTSTYAYGFYLLSLDDIKVLLDGVEQSTGFAVNGVGSQSGGAVLFTTPPAVGVQVQIMREVALERETDYQPNGDLRSQVLNSDFDRIWMAIQDRERDISRAIRYPVNENFDGTLINAAARAGTVLAFDGNGQKTYLPLPSNLGAGDLRFENGVDATPGFKAGADFTPGITAQLTLSRAPGSKANCWVYWDGIEQFDFTLNGTLLTFPTPINADIKVVNVRTGTTLSIVIPPDESVGDAQLQWGNPLRRNFQNIAELRATNDPAHLSGFVVGYTSKGDGGGGPYEVDPADLATPDNGITVIVDAINRRWKLNYNGPIDIRMGGAKSDGIMDVGAIINTILGLGRTALVPYTQAGWIINTTVTISKNKWVEFENPSVLIKSTSSTSIFRILGNSNEVIEPCGLRGGAIFDMAGSGVNSSVILMGTSSQNVASVRILGRYMAKNCYSFYNEEASATNFVVDVVIDDVYCQYTKGRQFYSKRSRGLFLVRSFVVDHTANTYVTNWEGIRVEDFIGFEGERLDVVGPVPANLTPAYQIDANSMVFAGVTGSGKASLFLTRATTDNTYGNGIIIGNVLNVECNLLAAYQNLGFGIQIIDCENVQISRILEVGSLGVPGASAGQQGLAIIGCQDVKIENVTANFNTSNGVYLHNTIDGAYTNITTKGNLNKGWGEDGTSNSNIKQGLLSYSNGTGSLVQVGAGSATCNWIPNSGVFTPSTVGPATV